MGTVINSNTCSVTLLKNYFVSYFCWIYLVLSLGDVFHRVFVLLLLQKMFYCKIYLFLDCKAFCGIISKHFLLKIQKIEFQQHFLFCKWSCHKMWNKYNNKQYLIGAHVTFCFLKYKIRKILMLEIFSLGPFFSKCRRCRDFFLLCVGMYLRQWLVVYFLSPALLLRPTSYGNHHLLFSKWSIKLCHFRDKHSVFCLWNCPVSISPLSKYTYCTHCCP